jgi:hypothetical protein
LTRVRCDENGTIREEQFDEVRYVRARTSMEAPAYVPEVDTDEGRPSASRAPRSLPVLKPEP